ncbi:hypothetical protein HMPREF9441_00983 [Paraprevotella clara YIT 11840]|uniref:Uncharacterized protein n=1 Tax=Paraprevotella clara YIT 11840 TaxID=762968 RepID=G5SNQ2_9BACT|nr:hypothetical protein HMPREF9441_00983 [Paraprevotella clara YIT 11840]
MHKAGWGIWNLYPEKIIKGEFARLTDLHNCTFHLTKIGKNTKVYFILLTFLLDIHLQGFFITDFWSQNPSSLLYTCWQLYQKMQEYSVMSL